MCLPKECLWLPKLLLLPRHFDISAMLSSVIWPFDSQAICSHSASSWAQWVGVFLCWVCGSLLFVWRSEMCERGILSAMCSLVSPLTTSYCCVCAVKNNICLHNIITYFSERRTVNGVWRQRGSSSAGVCCGWQADDDTWVNPSVASLCFLIFLR